MTGMTADDVKALCAIARADARSVAAGVCANVAKALIAGVALDLALLNEAKRLIAEIDASAKCASRPTATGGTE